MQNYNYRKSASRNDRNSQSPAVLYKIALPASDELRVEFDRNRGLQAKDKDHYPQVLIMTITAVLRQIPTTIKIVPCDRSERHEALNLIV